MFKKWLIEKIITFVICIIALGVGIWYLSSSIGGASLSYTNLDLFMKQIGAEGGNAESVNGCFLCGYIEKLFEFIGDATETFWTAIVHNLWIVMSIGFGVFIIIHTVKYLREQAASKDITDLTTAEPSFDFKKWFDKVWKTGFRVLAAGIIIGAISWSGTGALRLITNVTITPVMYLGTQVSMAATGAISGETCNIEIKANTENTSDILNPVLRPFMCVMGNLNTVMLAGAAGGFALMNYSYLGLGGGTFTWIAGLGLVLLFLVLGFDLIFQVLNVIFKLIFVIVFIPLLVAASAFEQVWSKAKDLTGNAINLVVNSAVSIIKISLKISILYAIVFFAADTYFPGPKDRFTSILPPLMGQNMEFIDTQSASVAEVFSSCEQTATVDGEIDKDTFVSCFKEKKHEVEQRYPGAFDFMDDGFFFLLFMIGVFFLYFWILSPKIDTLIGGDSKESIDYGTWVKDTGKVIYHAPGKIVTWVKDKMK